MDIFLKSHPSSKISTKDTRTHTDTHIYKYCNFVNWHYTLKKYIGKVVFYASKLQDATCYTKYEHAEKRLCTKRKWTKGEEAWASLPRLYIMFSRKKMVERMKKEGYRSEMGIRRWSVKQRVEGKLKRTSRKKREKVVVERMGTRGVPFSPSSH